MAFRSGEGGRPRGASNRVTKQLRDVLDKLATKGKEDLHAARLHQLTMSSDENVAIKALTLSLAYRHGKPTEHLELGGEGGGPVMIRFVDAGA